MLLLELFSVTFLLILQLCRCTGKEIQYSYKVVSDTKDDEFASSLATAYQRLIVGAPLGNYVLVKPGLNIRSTEGNLFGLHLNVNKQFMVVSRGDPDSVHVFSFTHPYKLVASIPLDGDVMDVKLLDDNTIYVGSDDGHVLIYDYNHHSSWSRKQKIILEDYGSYSYISLALSGDILAVGHYDGNGGRVNIYNKVNNEYTLTTALRSTELVFYFGISVAVEGQHLVVSSSKDYNNILFTYELDPSELKWTINGRFTVPSANGYSFVSLQNNTLAATVNDRHDNPEVCAYVYKFLNINKAFNNIDLSWKNVATLKTNGIPTTTDHQRHNGISIEDGVVFTGRCDYGGDSYGMVFVHNVNKD